MLKSSSFNVIIIVIQNLFKFGVGSPRWFAERINAGKVRRVGVRCVWCESSDRVERQTKVNEKKNTNFSSLPPITVVVRKVLTLAPSIWWNPANIHQRQTSKESISLIFVQRGRLTVRHSRADRVYWWECLSHDCVTLSFIIESASITMTTSKWQNNQTEQQ